MAKSKFPADLAKAALQSLAESFASAAGGLIAERWLGKEKADNSELSEKPITETPKNE